MVIRGLVMCRFLRVLNLWGTNMAALAGRALLQVLHQNTWPLMKHLDLQNNPGMDEAFGLNLSKLWRDAQCEKYRLTILRQLAAGIIAGATVSGEGSGRGNPSVT